KQNIHLSLSFGDVDPGSEPAKNLEPHNFFQSLAQVLMQPISTGFNHRFHHHGQPQIRSLSNRFTMKTGGAHADDGQCGPKHSAGSAQDVCSAAKAALPVVITDYYFRI